MALPAYDPSNVDLSAEAHAGASPLYEAIRKAQAQLADGFGVDDLIAIPEIAGKAQATIQYVLIGDEGDPSDDEEVAERLLEVGFALVRASQLLRKSAGPAPE